MYVTGGLHEHKDSSLIDFSDLIADLVNFALRFNMRLRYTSSLMWFIIVKTVLFLPLQAVNIYLLLVYLFKFRKAYKSKIDNSKDYRISKLEQLRLNSILNKFKELKKDWDSVSWYWRPTHFVLLKYMSKIKDQKSILDKHLKSLDSNHVNGKLFKYISEDEAWRMRPKIANYIYQ